MRYEITTATRRIASLDKRIRAIQGGTSAGKTIGILQVLIDKCQRGKPGEVTSVVSESFPHLKRGAIRDFLSIMENHRYFKEPNWNITDSIYTFETGAKLEFFSADQPSKVRGPRRKTLFLNEANNVPLETFEQLEVRTSDEIYMDWNPTSEFWFYEEIFGKRTDVDHLILTYRDNEALPKSIVDSIEQRKSRKGWWQVYGLGLLGEVEGRIYTGWDIADEIPFNAELVRIGVDFGYTNDPTSIVAVYRMGDWFIFDQIAYAHGLTNKKIAEILRPIADGILVIADSAEPKSIDEIRALGVQIVPCEKGPGSVNKGIQFLQGQKCAITSRSVDGIKEYRNYLWETDRIGKPLNIPQGNDDHFMSAIRYAVNYKSQLWEPYRREFKRNPKTTKTIRDLVKEEGL